MNNDYHRIFYSVLHLCGDMSVFMVSWCVWQLGWRYADREDQGEGDLMLNASFVYKNLKNGHKCGPQWKVIK